MSSVIGTVRRALFASLVALGVLGFGPAIAQAAVVADATLTGPTTVTVGQTALPASIKLINGNTTPDFVKANRVCNAGDPAPCGAPDRGILLVPACKQLNAEGQCTAAGADPNVFRVSATGTGTFGTCVGVTFTTTVLPDAFGTVRFTPAAGAHVTLPERDSYCTIAFTFDVLKSPTGDQDAGQPGTQTVQATEHTQCFAPCNRADASDVATVSSAGTTVLRAGPPAITTTASGDINLGGQLTDQATVSGLVNPIPGATVTFRLYPPSAPACTGTPAFSSTKPVTLAGTTATATSDAFTPTTGGVYRWIATYDGDANNLPNSGTCAEASETRTVTAPPLAPPAPAPAGCTPAPGPPPPGGTLCAAPTGACTPRPGPAPAGGVLCQRGSASIRGRTGCQSRPFNVLVSGRQIRRVRFSLDGKVVRTLTRPNSAGRYKLTVTPGKLHRGKHRVVARVTFSAQSATKARTLRVTFSRCRPAR